MALNPKVSRDSPKMAYLLPDTIFMEQDPNSNWDEILHLVPKDRDDSDPFYVELMLETPDRYWWSSPMDVMYSVFKDDVIFL